jgi:carboxylesterase type B
VTDKAFSKQNEDCLNLNIWAPSSGENLPVGVSPFSLMWYHIHLTVAQVFVYMYGGAMVTGSNSNPQLQGNNFARNGVIYVNFNTRESIFASPHSSELKAAHPFESQNFSILDMEEALQWVRNNIKGMDAASSGDLKHFVADEH